VYAWYSRLVTGGECLGGRGSVVTGWGRIEEVSEGRGMEWLRRGRKSSWERTIDCSTRKGRKVKGIRISIRK
jgi:hypothetical protein